jgi:hypothetical protein
VLGWPGSCDLAHAFLREYSDKGLELARLLGQRGVCPTWTVAASAGRPAAWRRAAPHARSASGGKGSPPPNMASALRSAAPGVITPSQPLGPLGGNFHQIVCKCNGKHVGTLRKWQAKGPPPARPELAARCAAPRLPTSACFCAISAAAASAIAEAIAAGVASTARARNRRFGMLSALRADTKAPYKTELLWGTLRVLKRPGQARTERPQRLVPALLPVRPHQVDLHAGSRVLSIRFPHPQHATRATWGDASGSARGAGGRYFPLGLMQIQREASRNPMMDTPPNTQSNPMES